MKKNIQFILVLLMVSSVKLTAQTPYFEVILKKVSLPTSAKDSFSVGYYFRYHDPSKTSPFFGNVFTNYLTQKKPTPAQSHTVFKIDSLHQLKDNDSTASSFFIKLTPDYFRNGTNNLIVIWPTGGRSNGKTVASIDSIHSINAISISGLTGINDENNAFNPVRIFPNPATTYLNVEINDPGIKIKMVRIIDIAGKERLVINENFSKIDVSSLYAGIYFLEVECIDNKKATYSFIVREYIL